jgi:succinate dehydrogenase hydrophobic anchor subunit
MSRSLRLALAIVEVTSIPLLILIILYVLSGYQMLYPYIRLIPASRAIHTDPLLRVIFVVLVYLHSLAGLIIIIERRLRLKMLKTVLEYIAILGLSLFLALCLTLDIVFR